jgi:polar amino acid transport system substrate-binding protein
MIMKVSLAYIEEPPFYWTGNDQSPTGADIELANVVLRAIGVTTIDYRLTSFEELLPGVSEGRWDMNVPIFATAARAERVAFSVPVWSLGDGFVVHRGNPKCLTSYDAVARRADARLGLIPGQIQVDAARSAGVGDFQIALFRDQPEALSALQAGKIDAFAATAVGNRRIADENPALEAVAHAADSAQKAPVGAFSFSKQNHDLLRAVNEQLLLYLGSPDHRSRMAKYGIAAAEIDDVVAGKVVK